jgi:hypothetical protein
MNGSEAAFQKMFANAGQGNAIQDEAHGGLTVVVHGLIRHDIAKVNG